MIRKTVLQAYIGDVDGWEVRWYVLGVPVLVKFYDRMLGKEGAYMKGLIG